MGNKRKLKNCKTSPFALASLSLVCVFKCRVAQENVDHKNSISPRVEPAACYIHTLSQAAFGNTRLAGRSMWNLKLVPCLPYQKWKIKHQVHLVHKGFLLNSHQPAQRSTFTVVKCGKQSQFSRNTLQENWNFSSSPFCYYSIRNRNWRLNWEKVVSLTWTKYFDCVRTVQSEQDVTWKRENLM
jgi:hypothetical protein